MVVGPGFASATNASANGVIFKGISSGPQLPLVTNAVGGGWTGFWVESTNYFANAVGFLNPMTIQWYPSGEQALVA
jgi:hypothetical protein